MMKELLVVNAGNTHIETLLVPDRTSFEQNGLSGGTRRVFTPEEFSRTWEALAEGKVIAAASVVPQFTKKLAASGAFLVTRDKKFPFRTDRVDMSTVGADRLANASFLCGGPLPAVSVDFGTAVTFEVVEEDRSFVGGAILPGRKLMRQALHDHTALLPLLPLTESLSQLPSGAGKNTKEAMLLGTDLACLGGVKEVLSGIRKDLERKYPGKPVRFCGCGGDRKFFLEALPFLEEVPFLTLQGICRIWRENGGEWS
ncbi:MAG: type III pantothenate kinase [Lentisphaeria bacterium]|nr:type III pantothenate kinase [Lentisphaeria bacterium]